MAVSRRRVPLSISEFSITTESIESVSAITSGPDGNLWFVDGTANSIGRITTDGVATEFPIPTPNAFPSDIASGPDGNLWFIERWGVGKITPAGVITNFPYPGTEPSPNIVPNGEIARQVPAAI